MRDARILTARAGQFNRTPHAGEETGRTTALSKCLVRTPVLLLPVLAGHGLLFAQTVGPETEIRSSATTGSAIEATAAFDLGTTYVAWRDTRSEGSSGGDIYVQKLDPNGQPLWTANGLAICVAANQQSLPAITPDGAGGALVTWLDDRADPNAVFAQRITAPGAVQWAVNGVFVGLVYSEQPFSFVHQATDGGFQVTWWDSGPSFGSDRLPVLAQKLDADGERLWDPGVPDNQDLWGSGIEVINGITRGRSAPDGVGGFVAMGKIRGEGGFRFQRVRADGSSVWPGPADFPVSLPDSVSFNFAPDGAGGMVVAYLEDRVMRAFRVAGDGTLPWGGNGITLQTNVLLGQLPFVAPNGTGGAFVAWVSSTPRDVHVQQLAGDGSQLWAAGGAVVPDGTSSEREPAMIRDGAGGAFLSFTTAGSLRGQRLDRDGNTQWRVGGSNGVSLGSGELPIIGTGTSGPNVVFKRGNGLFARSIAVATLFRLTNVAALANGQVSLTLSGGVPGRSYEVLRSPRPVTFDDGAWTVVGTVQTGQVWTDTNPSLPNAFYGARDPSP